MARMDLDNLKAQLDLHTVASKYTTLKQIAEGTYVGLCPLHNEKTPSFRIDTNKGLYYCFGCNTGGSSLTLIHKKENIPYGEMPKFLQDHYGIDAGINVREDAEKTTQLYVLKRFCETFYDHRHPAEEYVASRLKAFSGSFKYGLFIAASEGVGSFIREMQQDNAQLQAAINLGLLHRRGPRSYSCPFEGRVIFPMTRHGIVVGLNGRSTDNEEKTRKYLLSSSSKAFSKRHYVYGMDYARQLAQEKDINYVCVTEGVLDAIALLEVGIPAVSVLGSRVSTDQFSLILKSFNTVYITFDGDKAGASGINQSLYSAFQEGITISGNTLQLPEGMDVADFLNANHESPESIFQLPTRNFEDKIIDSYIITTRKSVADPNDVEYLKKKVLNKICEHLYDYKTNEFSKSLIISLSQRMSLNPSFIFSVIDRTMAVAHKKATEIINSTATEKFSLIVDIADLRLLRLVHTFPSTYSRVVNAEWFNYLSPVTKDLLDIIVERDSNPKADTVELINRKTHEDKAQSKEYIQVLTVGVYKLHEGFNWSSEFKTLDRIYEYKLEKSRERRLMKYTRDAQVALLGNPYKNERHRMKEKAIQRGQELKEMEEVEDRLKGMVI